MAAIILLGLNHNTAPVELRECIAFSEEDTELALEELHERTEFKEILLLSTCNRVELLLVTDDRETCVAEAKQFLAEHNRVPLDDVEPALYVHEGADAIRHVFRVASSLDSMMVGEPQILGQIKSAYRTATQKKTSGVILNRLLHRAFFVAKRVRSETGIGDHAVSISYAAIELGRKIFGTLEGKEVLLVGAGEMAELAVENLIRHHAGTIWVANRTFERGLELATRFGGRAIRLEEIPESLQHVDIIIGSTGATDLVITSDHVRAIMRRRKNRPLFFIDIAVPRDIDPAINRLTNCYVYDIDDLKEIIDENIEDRNREAIKGERIVEEATIRFSQWCDSLAVVPTIVALRRKMEDIIDEQIDKTLGGLKHFSETDREAFDRMKQALINKMLHDPTMFLKSNGCLGDRSLYLDVTRRMFNLDNER
ncbi:Glutamyl-tRNA reductase (EC [Olavius algarvensis associated proteobacterium Delta 3]|nr:Glutamyl-tRNA reductase (EC [Olavius algarvensis associated proteobacterium Delta 3]CAB5146755.1 Glutamyl-tRNA reductase (EC [Olavius algarvensis associated proteobacterium Delta 3]